MPDHWKEEDSAFVKTIVDINRDVSRTYNVTHLDSRKIYQAKILEQIELGRQPRNLKMYRGKQWPTNLTVDDYEYGGLYTFDGDHLNLRGSKLLMQLLADEIGSYEDIWTVCIFPSVPIPLPLLIRTPSLETYISSSKASENVGIQDAKYYTYNRRILQP